MDRHHDPSAPRGGVFLMLFSPYAKAPSAIWRRGLDVIRLQRELSADRPTVVTLVAGDTESQPLDQRQDFNLRRLVDVVTE